MKSCASAAGGPARGARNRVVLWRALAASPAMLGSLLLLTAAAVGEGRGGSLSPRCHAARVTTILTTIRAGSSPSAGVCDHPERQLTCEDEPQRTGADPAPTTGGQGVAGSNPVSPTE
jgi:hypothetical protein